MCVRSGQVARLWNPDWKVAGVPGAKATPTQPVKPRLTHACDTPARAAQDTRQTAEPTATRAQGSAALTGPACIIDADTIEIAGARVHLYAIDAPEPDQQCGDPPYDWPCGHEAMRALESQTGAESITCEQVYHLSNGDVLGRCHNSKGDINWWMVANGWAFSEPRVFDQVRDAGPIPYGYYSWQARPRHLRYGVWKDVAPKRPWVWRAEHEQ